MDFFTYIDANKKQAASAIDLAIRWVVIITAGLTPLLVARGFLDLSALPKALFIYAAAVVIIFLFMLRIILTKTLLVYHTSLYIPLLLVIAAYSVALAFSRSPILGIIGEYGRYQTVPVFIALVIIFWFCAMFFKDREWVDECLWSISISLGLVSLIGILQYLGLNLVSMPLSEETTRVGSTLGNPVFLADFIAITIPISLNLLIELEQDRRVQKIALLAVLSLAAIALMVSQSRGGMIAALVGIIVLVILRRDKTGQLLLIGAIPVAIVILLLGVSSVFHDAGKPSLATQVVERVSSTANYREGSFASRIELWNMSRQMIEDNPGLGYGLAQSVYIFPKYQTIRHMKLIKQDTVPDQAHNEFLQVAVDSGLVGSLAVLMLIAALFLISIKTISNKTTFMYGAIAALLAYGIKAMFSVAILTNLTIAAILTGLMAAQLIDRDKAIRKRLNLGRSRQIIGLAITLIFLAVMLYPAHRLAKADKIYNQGLSDYKIEGSSEIFLIEKADEALRLNPYQAYYRYETCSTIQEAARDAQDLSMLGKAVDLAAAGLKINPADSFFNLIIGQSYSLMSQSRQGFEQIEPAIAQLKIRTAAYPLHPDAHAELMKLYLRTDDLESAKNEARAIIKVTPTDKSALEVLNE